MGPGIPRINSMRGGFMGGVRTRYRSFFPPKFSKTPTYNGYPDYESQDEDNYQSPSYSRDKYYKKRPESFYKGNVFDFIILTYCIGFMRCKKRNLEPKYKYIVDRHLLQLSLLCTNGFLQ